MIIIRPTFHTTEHFGQHSLLLLTEGEPIFSYTMHPVSDQKCCSFFRHCLFIPNCNRNKAQKWMRICLKTFSILHKIDNPKNLFVQLLQLSAGRRKDWMAAAHNSHLPNISHNRRFCSVEVGSPCWRIPYFSLTNTSGIRREMLFFLQTLSILSELNQSDQRWERKAYLCGKISYST